MRGLLRRLFKSGDEADTRAISGDFISGETGTAPDFPRKCPPLPKPREQYRLVRSSAGFFEVFDGQSQIGYVMEWDGDGDRPTTWDAEIYKARWPYFRTFEEARAWLGEPPVQRDA